MVLTFPQRVFVDSDGLQYRYEHRTVRPLRGIISGIWEGDDDRVLMGLGELIEQEFYEEATWRGHLFR